MCIKQLHNHNIQSTQRTTRRPQSFIREKIIKHASTPMHRLPQCHLGNPQVQCHNIHQVNQYDTPLSPEVFIPQDIHHLFSNLNIQSNKTKLQRVKIQFIITRVEKGETSYDPSMLTKPMIYQDHDISRSREREIKHIATGTNPQPRGWTTPSSSWWPSG